MVRLSTGPSGTPMLMVLWWPILGEERAPDVRDWQRIGIETMRQELERQFGRTVHIVELG